MFGIKWTETANEQHYSHFFKYKTFVLFFVFLQKKRAFYIQILFLRFIKINFSLLCLWEPIKLILQIPLVSRFFFTGFVQRLFQFSFLGERSTGFRFCFFLFHCLSAAFTSVLDNETASEIVDTRIFGFFNKLHFFLLSIYLPRCWSRIITECLWLNNKRLLFYLKLKY